MLVGTVNETTASALPRIAETFVGASGAVAGVTEFDAINAGLVPIALVAITVNV